MKTDAAIPAGVAGGVRIRTAAVKDSASVAALMTALGYPTTGGEEMAERLRALLARSEDYLVAVAERPGAVVGVIAAAVSLAIEHKGSCGRITALSVHPDDRRRGIGALLLAHAETWLRARGADACIVNSHTRRADAHRFYRREGYEVTGLRFRKDLKDP
jgi:GNAT superfamily N-acetyltransferase